MWASGAPMKRGRWQRLRRQRLLKKVTPARGKEVRSVFCARMKPQRADTNSRYSHTAIQYPKAATGGTSRGANSQGPQTHRHQQQQQRCKQPRSQSHRPQNAPAALKPAEDTCIHNAATSVAFAASKGAGCQGWWQWPRRRPNAGREALREGETAQSETGRVHAILALCL